MLLTISSFKAGSYSPRLALWGRECLLHLGLSGNFLFGDFGLSHVNFGLSSGNHKTLGEDGEVGELSAPCAGLHIPKPTIFLGVGGLPDSGFRVLKGCMLSWKNKVTKAQEILLDGFCLKCFRWYNRTISLYVSGMGGRCPRNVYVRFFFIL